MPSFTFQTPLLQPAFSKPMAVRMGAARYDAGSWAKVLSAVVSALVLDPRYWAKALSVLEESSWCARDRECLRRPVETSNGWWVEGNTSASAVIKHLHTLLTSCGYPTDAVAVEYEGGEPIAKSMLAKWNPKAMPAKKDLPTQIEEFYDGVFSSDDFWEYAAEIYGLDTTPAAKAAQLRCLVQRFIRLDREHWISVPNFMQLSDWGISKESSVAMTLRMALGNATFLPMALLSDNILSSLPALHLEGKLISWSREFTASVAALLVPSVHVANHGIAPQTLTALLVQDPIDDDAVVDMALGVYCQRFPNERSVEGAFSFLCDNFIRSRLTDKLKAEIQQFLSSHIGIERVAQAESIKPLEELTTTPDNSDENAKLLDAWADGVF